MAPYMVNEFLFSFFILILIAQGHTLHTQAATIQCARICGRNKLCKGFEPQLNGQCEFLIGSSLQAATSPHNDSNVVIHKYLLHDEPHDHQHPMLRRGCKVESNCTIENTEEAVTADQMELLTNTVTTSAASATTLAQVQLTFSMPLLQICTKFVAFLCLLKTVVLRG